MLLLIKAILKIRIWRLIHEFNTFGSSKVRRCDFECEIGRFHVRRQSSTEIGETRFRSCPPCGTVHWVKQKRNDRSYFLWSYQSKSSVHLLKQWPRKTLGKDISSLIFSVHIINFDSFSGNFLLDPNIDLLCSYHGFDWAGNLSCTWIITEIRSILAVENPFISCVAQVDNVLHEYNFCDSFKQSIKLSFYGTSWDVMLFSLK